MTPSNFLTFAIAITLSLLPITASAEIYKGFNYGAGIDFLASFRTAKTLVGTSGFSSARLYTMIEANTTNTPTSAISAAIATNTSLLLGLYCSAGQLAFENETIALTAAIVAYGQPFVGLIAGISVGSEDLYRSSPVGIQNKSPPGDTAANIVSYIDQTRAVLNSTRNGIAKDKKVGHVDTWQMWQSAEGIANVLSAVDFVGVDAYPYWQKNDSNAIANDVTLFEQAYQATVAAVGDKEVWVTETGWPVTGSTFGQAVPSKENAQRYWVDVGCGRLFGKVNTWWYTLQDYPTAEGAPGFGVVNTIQNSTALFDLSCMSNVTGDGSLTRSMGVGVGGTSTACREASATVVESSGVTGTGTGVLGRSTGRTMIPTSTAYITSTVVVVPTPASAVRRRRRI
ncbi:MAG: hypothetical protein LQ350_002860 [Teloschistes chrysophthalmus]|nr:MAG: hypothetical protein LQ350_002860 [Niorma chrysophthalma]